MEYYRALFNCYGQFQCSGRDHELTKIQAVLIGSPQPTASHVIVISGRGGIGKTALAITVGTLERTNFTDGILFADLGGTGNAPVTPDTILMYFLISLWCSFGNSIQSECRKLASIDPRWPADGGSLSSIMHSLQSRSIDFFLLSPFVQLSSPRAVGFPPCGAT